MFTKLNIILILLTVVCISVQSQNISPLSLSVNTGTDIPLGPDSPEGNDLYTIGGFAELAAEYTLPFIPGFFAKGIFGYSMIPTTADTSLSLLSLGAGAGIRSTPLPKLEIKLAATTGYSLGIYQDNIGGAPFVKGAGTITYALSPTLNLGLGVSYDHHFSLYNGFGIFLGAGFGLGSKDDRSRVEPVEIHIDPVFPVFYSHYDDNPLGSTIITNNEKGTIKDVKISFFVSQYMEKPKLSARIPEMKKEEEQSVQLYGLFTDRILEITEGTKVTAEIIVEYSYLDNISSGSTSKSIQIYHRNAMTWEDDRRAASFITAKDPEVLRFSKNIAGKLRAEGSLAVNSNLRAALGQFEALKLYGINYVIDPASSYIELSENKFSLDYLQFPVQTLSYKAGDCDDLSILYSALLESIGIETAFITIPGHIYMAFSLNMNPAEAEKVFPDSDDLIIYNEQAFIPVEITMIQDGFMKAWQMGAKQWVESNSEGTASFYPIHDAWRTYAPVGIAAPNTRIEGIPEDQIIRAYNLELGKFIERQIGSKVKSLQERIGQNNDPKLINRLGVLYARFGLYDKAKVEFEIAVNAQFQPALVNLGNILSIQNKYQEALESYRQAAETSPDNISLLVGIVKANYELGNIDQVRTTYKKIENLSPDTAQRFSYIVSGNNSTVRASTAVMAEDFVWDEGE